MKDFISKGWVEFEIERSLLLKRTFFIKKYKTLLNADIKYMEFAQKKNPFNSVPKQDQEMKPFEKLMRGNKVED